MIIFDLDGTLADCEHRRHFVDPLKNPNVIHGIPPGKFKPGINILADFDRITGEEWKPDWQAFYEACDQDIPIIPSISILITLWIKEGMDIEIWSGRCESVRDKTQKWLEKYIFSYGIEATPLKMRPIGDNTPDDQLKERWLDEHIAAGGEPIDMVFDDRPKVIRMWRRRGIFVFNCCQHDQEF
jgi:hypothetical protein